MDNPIHIREMSPEETPQLADLLATFLMGEHSKSKIILKLLWKRNSLLWMVFISILVYYLTECVLWAVVVPPVVVILGILRALATWSCTVPELFTTLDVFGSCGGESRRTWVAVTGGRVVGSVTVVRQSDSVAELNRMRVCREYQGRGIGRRLVGQLESYCRECGIKQISLKTSEYQDIAMRMYQRFGYISDKTGDYSKALFPGVGDPAFNVSVDVYAFRKELMI
ncbi:putative N-acetyltransferase 14 [Branchiostoma floridae x Branchiostoma belcheri]